MTADSRRWIIRLFFPLLGMFVGFCLAEWVLKPLVASYFNKGTEIDGWANAAFGIACTIIAGITTDWIRYLVQDPRTKYEAFISAIQVFFGGEREAEDAVRVLVAHRAHIVDHGGLYRQVCDILLNDGRHIAATVLSACKAPYVVDDYHDQIRVAALLCGFGRQRLWATSTDPTLVFHRENAFYYHALEK